MKVSTLVKVLAVVMVAVIATGVAIIASIDVNDYKGDIAEQVKSATGRDLQIAGDMDLSISFSPAITVDDVTFANAEWGSGPNMAKLGYVAVEVSLLPLLTGDVQVKKLVLRDLDLLLETDGEGKGNWEFPGAAAEPTESTSSGGGTIPWVGVVEVQNLRVTWRDGQTAQTTSFALASFTGQSDGPNDPLAFELAGTLNDQELSGQGTTGALTALTDQAPFPFDVTVTAAGASVAAKGTVRLADVPELDAEVAVSGDDLATVGALAGATIPGGKFRLAAALSGTAEAVTVKGLQAALGETNLAGDAEVDLTGARPSVKARLTSSMIDLDALMPPQDAAEPPADSQDTAKTDKKRVFPDDPLPLDGLHAADADIKLNAGTVRINRMDIKDLAVALVLKDGTLTVNPMTASIAGGTLNNRVTLVAKGDVLALNADTTIAKLDFGRLLAEMEVSDEVEGIADGKIRLAGSGRSVRELMAGLDGNIEIVSGKGRIKNEYLALASADVLGTITPFLKKKDASVMNCMVARFVIKKGQATTQGLVLDTETMTISGKGGIDLRTEELDLTFTPRPKEASLMKLAVPVVASGTLADPSIGPEAMGTAKAAAGAALTFVNPLVALAPLVIDAVSSKENACLAALENKGEQSGAGSSGSGKEEGGVGGLIKGLGKSLNKTLGND